MKAFKEVLTQILHDEEDGTELIDTVDLIMSEIKARMPKEKNLEVEYNSALADTMKALGIEEGKND